MFVEPIAHLLGRVAGEILGVVVPQHHRVPGPPTLRELAGGQFSVGWPEQSMRRRHQVCEQAVRPHRFFEELPGRNLFGRKMREGMIANRVSLGGDAANQVWVSGGLFAEQEIRRAHTERTQHLQGAWRVAWVGTIVKREANLAAVGRPRHHKCPPWQNGGHSQPRPLARSSAQ